MSWKQGSRGKRYWLPEGMPDLPQNRLYGPKAEQAAQAVKNKADRGRVEHREAMSAQDEAKATFERAKRNGVTGLLLERLRRRAEGSGSKPVPSPILTILASADEAGDLERVRRWAKRPDTVLTPPALVALAACYAVASERRA